MDSITAERERLSEAIQSLQTDVERLQHELQVSEDKMAMIVQYPSDHDGFGCEGEILGPDLLAFTFIIYIFSVRQY